MTAEIRDDRFYDVVGVDVKVERQAADFVFTEGPAWHPREGHLTFSDIKGNRMHRWTPKARGGGEVSVFREPSNMGNGSTYDGEGRLLTCEHATSRVVRAEGGGRARRPRHPLRGQRVEQPERYRRQGRRGDLFHRSDIRAFGGIRCLARAGV